MTAAEEMLVKYEESERIAARIEAIHRLRPDIAVEAERLLRAWSREKLAPLEEMANPSRPRLDVKISARTFAYIRALRALQGVRERTLFPRSNRRRRSSILCKIGRHDWEAWELSGPGLRFVKRCRRHGCRAARAIKAPAIGPTEPMMAAKLRGGSDG